jgi:hypothetical protein
MASTASLTSSTSPARPSSPPAASLLASAVASLPVTGVLEREKLEGSQRSSSDAMEALQRQQTQPAAAAPVLSPSRISPADNSVIDDIDDILSLTPSPAAPVPVPVPAAASGSAPVKAEASPESAVFDLVAFCVDLTILEIEQKISGDQMKEADLACLAKEVNRVVALINPFLTELLQKRTSLTAWLKQESRTLFFMIYQPLSAGYFLNKQLPKLPCLRPHLSKDLMAEFSTNYPHCALLLTGDLEVYLEKSALDNQEQMIEKAMQMIAQNPQCAPFVREQLKVLKNPNAAAQDSEKALQSTIEPLHSFFQQLAQELRAHPTDRAAIEAWLKSQISKADYMSPFFLSHETLNSQMVQALPIEELPKIIGDWKTLFETCCEKLKALRLEKYIHECPSPAAKAQMKQKCESQKDTLNEMLPQYIFVFKLLAEALRQLPSTPEDRESNRRAIENWFTDFKSKYNYCYPFFSSPGLHGQLMILEGIIDQKILNEFAELYPFCRDQLTALGLEKYLTELPGDVMTCPHGYPCPSPAAAQPSPAAARKELSISQQIEKENQFFLLMLQQDEIETWLKKNSPKHDYPLLWGKKRVSRRGDFREVNVDLRSSWRDRFETCLEKLVTPELCQYVNLEQIPADASPELRAFLRA